MKLYFPAGNLELLFLQVTLVCVVGNPFLIISSTSGSSSLLYLVYWMSSVIFVTMSNAKRLHICLDTLPAFFFVLPSTRAVDG